MVKPSEMSLHTSHVIKALIEKYLDPECYACIEGGPLVAQELLRQRWDLIVFTGSSEKGKIIARAAAEHMTPTILELGGKSPAIVDPSANITNAALRIAQGRFTNSG
jgi:aldehyde dehydrogenase (NAD+)